MNHGYIKLWRKFKEWEWFKCGDMPKFFIWLLLSATHKESSFMGRTIQRGQVVFGLHKASENTGITPQSIRSCIKRLKSTNEITSQSTNRFTIITIINYDSYQSTENEINKPINKPINKQLTNNQQTTNNIQECKEHKNKEILEFLEYFNSKTKKRLTLTDQNKRIIESRLRDHSLIDLKRAVDNFSKDTWADRHKYCDVVYCIGIRNKVDNLDRWLNVTDQSNEWVKP